jgi:DNA-directed RNA polymerase subunit RPC12/RpoP
MELTRVRKKQYMDNGGNICPYCGSNDLDCSRFHSDNACAWQNITCSDCKKEWRDVYTLTDIEKI